MNGHYSVADPGFPVGGGGRAPVRGGRGPIRGGRGPPMWALFGENVCENERIGSHRGGRAPGTPPLDPPMLFHIHSANDHMDITSICTYVRPTLTYCVILTSLFIYTNSIWSGLTSFFSLG